MAPRSSDNYQDQTEFKAMPSTVRQHTKDLDSIKGALTEAKKTQMKAETTFTEIKSELKESKSLIIVGFIVLLVMVAGMLLDMVRGNSSSPVVVNNIMSGGPPTGATCTAWRY